MSNRTFYLKRMEPELPVLLQPVAATEASAMTATRGIRRFMTSSPIWFTCVEDKVSAGFAAWARSDRHAPPRRATTDLPRTSRATASSWETERDAMSSARFSCALPEKVARKTCRSHLT